MLELIFFIPKEAQKKLILEFIKPRFLALINAKKISSFTYFSYPKRIILEIFTTEDKQSFEERLTMEWDQFLETERSYFEAFKTKGVQTLFRELSMNYIKVTACNNASATDPYYARDTALINLYILEDLVENEYDFEYSICLLFTYLYCLGGYSPRLHLQLSKTLKETLEFYAGTKEKLDTEVALIISENEEEIKNRLETLFLELSAFYSLDTCPTKFSKWKLSYGILVNDVNSDNIILFEKFKSQLFFSDHEIYMILAMIINYHKEGFLRTDVILNRMHSNSEVF